MPRWVPVVVLWVVGCAAPSEGPERAARAWLDALSERDGAAAWSLLAPDDRDRVSALYSTLRETRQLLETGWPPTEAPAAIAAAGCDVLDRVEDARGLFMDLFATAGNAITRSAVDRFSAQAREVSHDGDDRATVITWGGDRLSLERVSDQWRVALSEDDRTRLSAIEASAERLLGRVQREVDAARRKRYGVSSSP